MRPLLSNSTSASTSQRAAAAHAAARLRARRFRPLRLAVLLLLTALLSLLVPDCFRFAVRQFVIFEAWRHGVDAQIGSVGGSLFAPVVLRKSVWSYQSENGPVTRLEIKTATAAFSARHLLPRSSGQWFQSLTLEGVTGKVGLPFAGEKVPHPTSFVLHLPRLRGRWLAGPERFEAADVDFIFASGNDYLRLVQTSLTLSSVEAGEISAGQVIVKQPWLARTFRNVSGTTAMQDGNVQVAGLSLEPGVQIQDFTLSLDDFARGQLKIAVELAAFGGNLRAEAQTLPHEPQFAIYVAGPFSQIDVAQLATFLGVSDAAGGTIKTGNFSFRGRPQQFAKASAQLRFEAANFQWETRQWDSLVLGVKLLDGRIQIPELALTQGPNRLSLSGDMALPMPGVAWWRSEFSCDIAAKIENLTELSALLLPEFKFAAGRANIDGSIRGRDQRFTGQILVSGTNLRWRNAPIEKLNASVKLNGNEYQITNVSLLNGADYVNGSGVVNIVGDKQYWGELRASVEDLGKYAAILQKPVVPESPAGGALIDWSGEGSAKGHSGKFLARLRKIRSLGASAALLHPINADFEGSYSNGGMVFSTFALSDDESSFTAHVGVVNKAVSLQSIRLMHKQALRLEGDALLPFDVWNAWPNTALETILDDQTVGKLNLTAYDLSLNETVQLSGFRFPIEGFLRGNLTAEGPLGALKTGGKLTLANARLPLGWSGAALTGVEATVTLDGQTLRVEKLTGLHPTGDFSASGDVNFTNLRDPALKLAVTSAKSRLHLFPMADGGGGLEADTTLALQVTGPLSGALVNGVLKVTDVSVDGWDLEQWDRALVGDLELELPPVFALPAKPWSQWRFDVRATSSEAGRQNVMLTADLRLTGSGAAPALVGRAEFIPVSSHGLPALTDDFRTTQVRFDFRDGFPSNPSVSADATGTISTEPFAIYVAGTLRQRMLIFSFHPPLTEKVIRTALISAPADRLSFGEDRFSLLVPAELREGIVLSDWSAIKAEPAAEISPVPGNGTPL